MTQETTEQLLDKALAGLRERTAEIVALQQQIAICVEDVKRLHMVELAGMDERASLRQQLATLKQGQGNLRIL